ncbi:MAG TPA: 3-hydroxyacyl-CoA dehydrogenase NAD-binding domain-containing protein [Nitrospiria bacterium]|nr:3-hydroxyacyl-CoA dehydrogenase NAD-binding domain-containing protein [Nitrospiria bacterium]
MEKSAVPTKFPGKIAVIGAGRMGTGIAQICLVSGLEVSLFDVSDDPLKKGKERIESGLDTAVERGTLPALEKAPALSRLHLVNTLSGLKDADFVIEAAVEIEKVKIEIFREIDALLSEKMPFATNTSSISITRLAGATRRPEKVIGMHFMNPVPVMPLVEIIRGTDTSEETFTLTRSFAEKLGKTVVVSRDRPGFIVNRILMPMINEAVFALMEGVASAQDIDLAMKAGAHFPQGPLELADLIGLDVCLDILQVLHRDLGDPKYRPCPLLRNHVEAGWLGKKSGRGFYSYI